MNRVRSDLVAMKMGSMWGKFVPAVAAVPTDSLPWTLLWLGTQMKVMDRGMEDRMARRV